MLNRDWDKKREQEKEDTGELYKEWWSGCTKEAISFPSSSGPRRNLHVKSEFPHTCGVSSLTWYLDLVSNLADLVEKFATICGSMHSTLLIQASCEIMLFPWASTLNGNGLDWMTMNPLWQVFKAHKEKAGADGVGRGQSGRVAWCCTHFSSRWTRERGWMSHL